MPPEPTLRRLPWYLAYVSQLRREGVESVSSTTISRNLNVDASRIAKDLSVLGLRGKTRIGYDTAELERRLEAFLGFRREHNAVIAGVGSLGAALISDKGLRRYGLNIVAGFDVNPELIGREVAGVEVYSMDEVESRRVETAAEVGILAVPASCAQEVSDRLVAAGVKAVWNFTPRRILVPDGTVIHNTSIYANLAVIYNRLEENERGLE